MVGRRYDHILKALPDNKTCDTQAQVQALSVLKERRGIKKPPIINPETPLVDLKEASERLRTEKGARYTVNTLREYCRSGRLVMGFHWVKPGRQYLISLEAVYYTLATSKIR